MIWTFLVYLLILLAIGVVAERQTKDLSGFVLGNRQMGRWATALSYEATAYSGWLMMGFPGRAFGRGLVAVWVGLACVLGDALNWISIARRLRQETERLQAITIPEYLDRKFPREGSRSVRVAASLAILLFMSLYLWSQFVAAGKAIATVTDVSYTTATILSSAVILIYTFQGGYRAVVWTDAFQGVMMVIALLMLPAICLYHIGGFSELQQLLQQAASDATTASDGTAITGGHLAEWFAGLTGLALFSFLFEDAGVGAGFIGQPHICVRFMSIRNEKELRPAFYVSIISALLMCGGAVLVGLVAHGWFRIAPVADLAGPAATTVAATADTAGRTLLHDAEEVLPRLAVAVLPDWLAGFVVSAIMAAIMSSAASYLISASSSLVQDVYHRLWRPQGSPRELLLASRLVTLSLGLAAMMMALGTDPLDKKSAVYYLVLSAWGGLAGSFAAPMVLSLYYRRMTRKGCLAGIVVGACSSVAWHNTPALASVAYEVIPSILLSAIAIVVVSEFSRPAVVSELPQL